MTKRRLGSREEDSWLSDTQLSRLVRAEEADTLGAPVPTQVVSNGEYFPSAQTAEQREVEARIAEIAGAAAKRLGMSRRRFLGTSGGMAAAFPARHGGFGWVFAVSPRELFA